MKTKRRVALVASAKPSRGFPSQGKVGITGVVAAWSEIENQCQLPSFLKKFTVAGIIFRRKLAPCKPPM